MVGRDEVTPRLVKDLTEWMGGDAEMLKGMGEDVLQQCVNCYHTKSGDSADVIGTIIGGVSFAASIGKAVTYTERVAGKAKSLLIGYGKALKKKEDNKKEEDKPKHDSKKLKADIKAAVVQLTKEGMTSHISGQIGSKVVGWGTSKFSKMFADARTESLQKMKELYTPKPAINDNHQPAVGPNQHDAGPNGGVQRLEPKELSQSIQDKIKKGPGYLDHQKELIKARLEEAYTYLYHEVGEAKANKAMNLLVKDVLEPTRMAHPGVAVAGMGARLLGPAIIRAVGNSRAAAVAFGLAFGETATDICDRVGKYARDHHQGFNQQEELKNIQKELDKLKPASIPDTTGGAATGGAPIPPDWEPEDERRFGKQDYKKSNYKKGDDIGLHRFNQRVDSKTFRDPKTGQIIERDNATNSGAGPHGGSSWKLFDVRGKKLIRIGTITKDGVWLRK